MFALAKRRLRDAINTPGREGTTLPIWTISQAKEKFVVFDYPGDDGSRVTAWFKGQLRAIGTCLKEGLPEASLTLVYAGIDTFGLLGAQSGVDFSTRSTFIQWCEGYILTRLHAVGGGAVPAIDLYAARCGVLHTSTPLSDLERKGQAHEIWYQFLGQTGVNLITDAKLEPLILDVQELATAFKEGGLAFMADLQQDTAKLANAEARAAHFLRWGKASM